MENNFTLSFISAGFLLLATHLWIQDVEPETVSAVPSGKKHVSNTGLVSSKRPLDPNAVIGSPRPAVATSKAAVEPSAGHSDDAIKVDHPLNSAYRVSGRYGNRIHPVHRVRKFHKGIDLACKSGTPVYAFATGKVAKVAYSTTYGNYILINHGGSFQTRYAHLSSVHVRQGDVVSIREHIGRVGSTGMATGPHLHFECIYQGRPIDPESIINF